MIRSMLMISLTALVLAAQTQTPQPPPQVISHGEGVVSVKPDQVRIQIGVTNQAPTASEAGTQNAKQSAAVIAELKQQLGTAAEYQTANYSLYPNYRTQRDGGNPTAFAKASAFARAWVAAAANACPRTVCSLRIEK